MNITYKDFIGVYEGALSKENCDLIIQRFENHVAINPSSIRNSKEQFNEQEMGRLDFCIFLGNSMPEISSLINKTLDSCINFYTDQYFSLKQVKARSEEIKLQRTPPRGGFHVWHSEKTRRYSMDRVLTWMIYLNDIPDGEGETEFLWQGCRVKPKAGTCVIWPAQFTHPHRGNPVYSCDKYIATGWYTVID